MSTPSLPTSKEHFEATIAGKRRSHVLERRGEPAPARGDLILITEVDGIGATGRAVYVMVTYVETVTCGVYSNVTIYVLSFEVKASTDRLRAVTAPPRGD